MLVALCISFLVAAVLGQQQSEVAFSAGLDHHLLLQHNTTVMYNKVFSNVGAGYDSSTGVFTCQLPGTYVFEYYLLARQSQASWLELYRNNEYISSAFGHTPNDYATAGNTAILTLNQGDTVYIKSVDNQWGYNTNIYGLPDEIYTTFSGYLVHATGK